MPCNLSYQSNFRSGLIGSIFQFDNAFRFSVGIIGQFSPLGAGVRVGAACPLPTRVSPAEKADSWD